MAIERIPFGYLLIADDDIKAQVERRNKSGSVSGPLLSYCFVGVIIAVLSS